MPHITASRRSIPAIGTALGGVFLIGWGIASILAYPGYPTTVSPIDTVLVSLSHYLWIPAVGFFVLSAGVAPLVRARATHDVAWAIGVTVFGAAALCVGGLLTVLALDSVAGLLYVSPLLLSGVLLVLAGSADRVRDRL